MDIKSFIKGLERGKGSGLVAHHEVIEPRKPSFGELTHPLPEELNERLAGLGIERLYSHQALGIDLVRDGKNVVVMTPTASGKSLVYNVPVIESMLTEPGSHALYIFPLKGLEQDQVRAFNELTEGLPGIEREKTKARRPIGLAEIYDGDTGSYRRGKIRESPPPVVLTNPDMLHLGINAFHAKWDRFFRGLKYVVVDEVHTYRGVFGSHVAHVLRRLRRCAHRYGSDPVFIACSATIANPVRLAEELTGLSFELVDATGAPAGKRNFIFVNPPEGTSPYTVANRLFISSVRAGFKTIAFTKARRVTELMHAWVRQSAPDLEEKISSYRAGFLPAERRDIERRLFSGELTGVISTSALELGVDIGGLDVCILVGYPGTIASTWQRSGRVGRSGKDSLILMVGQADALDQYFMRNPGEFFKKSVEAALVDTENRPILKSHLMCAAAEAYIKADDPFYDTKRYSDILQELEAEGRVRHWAKGDIWYPRQRNPHREVSIRETGDTFVIRTHTGAPIGSSSSARVFHDLHPGAVYLHKGAQYRVKKLDMGNKEVECVPADDVEYYTRPITNEETEIISVQDKKRLSGLEVNLGTLRVTEEVIGYRKKHIYTDENLGEYLLELPQSIFTTTGIWMKVDEDILDEIEKEGYSVAGGLHALEHAAIAALPLFALCDRMDLGGVSYPMNPELESAAIFIYDGHEGGVGLTRRGLDCLEAWFTATKRLMQDCECEVSCPSCTQDPKCGNNNDPLDKRAALVILKSWLGR